MKHQPLLAIVLLITTAASGLGKSLSEETQRGRLRMIHRLEVKNSELTLLERAYLDAAKLLESSNRCGEFFGGRASRQVLDELVIRLRVQTIPNTRIGVRMSGNFKVVESLEGITYRLFEHTELNSLGAFYRSKTFPSEQVVPNMGSFAPNTRQSRAMILLHELAHLIKGQNGLWLIPDDGSNAQLSNRNTKTIEAQCGEQIRSL